jgi:hypothetical protein
MTAEAYELPAIMALLTALEAAVFATDGDPTHPEVVTARNAVRAAVQGAIFAERERAEGYREALATIAAQGSSLPGSTSRVDCMAALAAAAIRAV